MKKRLKKVIKKTTGIFTHPIKTLPEYKCRFCHNEWIPRKTIPIRCPRCGRPKWFR
jgi:rubrerythrin